MSGVCRICGGRKAGPIGWLDPTKKLGHREKLQFCSARCERVVWRWMEGKKGGVMATLCETEKRAVQQCPQRVGQYLLDQGLMGAPFASMSRDQVVALIEKIVEIYQDQMYVLTEADGPPVSF